LRDNVNPRLLGAVAVLDDAVLDRAHLDAGLASRTVIFVDQRPGLRFADRSGGGCLFGHIDSYAISTMISSNPAPAGTIGKTFSAGSMMTSMTTVRCFTSSKARSSAEVSWPFCVTRMPTPPCASANFTKSGTYGSFAGSGWVSLLALPPSEAKLLE